MRPGSRLRTLCVLSGIAALNVSIATSALGQGVPAAKRPPGKPAAPAAPAAPAIKPLVETLTGESRTEYQAGKVLFDDGDYATALQKFKNAQSKQPDPRLLYNMASAEKSLRH